MRGVTPVPCHSVESVSDPLPGLGTLPHRYLLRCSPPLDVIHGPLPNPDRVTAPHHIPRLSFLGGAGCAGTDRATRLTFLSDPGPVCRVFAVLLQTSVEAISVPGRERRCGLAGQGGRGHGWCRDHGLPLAELPTPLHSLMLKRRGIRDSMYAADLSSGYPCSRHALFLVMILFWLAALCHGGAAC